MESIPQVYYINLDYRTDRRLQMEDWLEESGFPTKKVERISAIHTPDRGHVGAGLSHIKAIETFLKSEHTICLICEDDYMPLDVKTFWQTIQKPFDDKVSFDMILCAYNELQSDAAPVDYLKRVLFSYTASGYILTRHFAPFLLENFKDALRNIINQEAITNQKANDYCIDVHWMPLMKQSTWYCFFPRIGKQRDSYSDIQNHFTTYVA
jgi:GR25 family glycosyltransferase involved in LPS biosynthesis